MKITLVPFGENSRDMREILTALDAGWDRAHVIGPPGQEEIFQNECRVSYDEISLRPYGDGRIKKAAGKIAAFFHYIFAARKIAAKAISGHDILGLTIAYFAAFGRKDTSLIYDAHEYELGRYVGEERSKFKKRIIAFWEKFLIKRSKLSIICNQSIADKMEEDYSLSFPKVVSRNIPVLRDADAALTLRVKELYNKRLDLKQDSVVMMYHGIIKSGRGIEIGIEQCADIKNLFFVVLGFGEKSYLEKLEKLAAEKNLGSRFLLLEGVSGSELVSYISACDFELILIEPVSESYEFALPNKLFESIHAGKPMLASNFADMKKIVEDYDLGFTCNPLDPEEVREKIFLLMDEKIREEKSQNAEKARLQLNWDIEKTELEASLKNILKDAEK